MYRFLIIFFISLPFCSCKKNPTPSIQDSFPGYYEAKKITSTVAVDMNNDGLKSTDLYSEISGPVTTPDGQYISFYNFESITNYIEVRPLHNQSVMAKYIDFNFPHQVIDSLSDNTAFLMTYKNELLGYTYEFNGNNSVRVTSSNPAYTNEIGKINNLTLKEGGNLTIGLKKRVFDFVDKTWQEIDIVVEYFKAP